MIDEVDEMLNLGFRTQLKNIMELLPPKRQNLVFSATMPDEVEQLIYAYFRDPVRVEAAPVGTPLDSINQSVYYVPNFNTKVNLLVYLLTHDTEMNKVLVFAETKRMADQVFEQIETLFPDEGGVIHSNKSQNHRFNTVEQFKNGNYRFIIATDIVARGIDISEVSHVVNFDTPDIPEAYIHRIGRTGRADKFGISITFVTEKEKEYLAAIEQLMNYTIPVVPLPADVEISDILTEDELPKANTKEIQIRLPKIDEGGGAFHEKLAKNKKVNVKIKHSEKMMKKYGKPITRGQKKK